MLPDCSETDNCINGVDTEYIDPYPCKNDGACSDVPGENFLCACSAGWTGRTCEDVDDPCTSDSSCGTNAECVVTHPGVSGCRCRDGFQGDPGDECVQIDECLENNPCLNGAECRDNDVPGQDPTCDCLDGTSGLRCEEDVDECAENPCDNGLCMDSRTNFYVPLDEVVCACNLGRGSTNGGDNCDRSITYRQGTASAASYYTYYVALLLLIIILCVGACASGKYFKRGMDVSKGSIGAATSLMPTGSQRWVQKALQASIDTALDIVAMDDSDSARGSQTQKQWQQPSYAPQAADRPAPVRRGAQDYAATSAQQLARAPAGNDEGFQYGSAGAYGVGAPARPSSTAGGSVHGSAAGLGRVAPRRPTGMGSVSSFEKETMQRPGRVRPRPITPPRRSVPPSVQSIQSAGRAGRDVV